MVKLIIKRLVIRNFKIFEALDITLESDRLVVLDGPNGFGKSSFFDALELLLTGTIRRYVELEEITVDGRSQKFGCPWLYNHAEHDSWLSIRAELVVEGQAVFLERSACKKDLDQVRGLRNLNIPLYVLEDLGSERDEEVVDEVVFFSKLLGEEYQRDFELFHYVEQEENTRILKQKEKDRQQKIAHLFEIGGIQKKINGLKEAYRKLGKLCGAQQINKANDLKEKWQSAKKSLLPEGEAIDYERLISITNQPWDQKSLEYDVEYFEQWLSADGELFRLRGFIDNLKQYENLVYNRSLTKELLPSEDLQRLFLKFYHRVDYLQDWKLDLQKYTAASGVMEAFKDIVNSVKSDQLALPDVLFELLPDSVTPDDFKHHVDKLKQQVTSANKLEECVANLLLVRKQLVGAFEDFQLHGGGTEICPTCGHDWTSVEELVEGIDKQGEALKNLAEEKSGYLSKQLEEFRQACQEPIEQSLHSFIESQRGKIGYKKQAIELSSEIISWMNAYYDRLVKEGIEFEDLLLSGYDTSLELPLDEFKHRVIEKFKPVDASLIHTDFDRLYREVFSGDLSAAKKLTLSGIDKKILYLKQQQSIASSSYTKKCEKDFFEASDKIKSAQEIRRRLKKIIDIYEHEKQRYLESIVKEIEILFHIYSGRLMQNFQQGLGIFIENDGSSIAFHETPGKSHDVVFSMSSGQLAALVLSFTLALNQRYAKHSLLLIDDPVQTLDEINVAGFVELLRTDFSNRQIVVSTHEDRISAYFRYKYKKFGLPVARINFMEKSRAEIEA